MFLMRAASAAAALTLLILFGTGEVAVSGQSTAAFRGRSVERRPQIVIRRGLQQQQLSAVVRSEQGPFSRRFVSQDLKQSMAALKRS